MYERLILIRELLSERGSLFVHCDRCSQHLLRCLLDEVFGASFKEERAPGLVNEIIWDHLPEPVNQNDRFASSHDTIFWYSKTGRHYFNEINIAKPDPEESETEEVGAPGTVWSLGEKAHDLREAVGYPTQKPEALLERIILLASAPGSIVMDCFMGSGTTGVVAMRTGRRFLGTDVCLYSPESYTLKEKRDICNEMISTSSAILDAMRADFESLPSEARATLLAMLCESGTESPDWWWNVLVGESDPLYSCL